MSQSDSTSTDSTVVKDTLEVNKNKIDDIPVEEEDVPIAFAQNMPSYNECKGSNSNLAINRCTQSLMRKRISEAFIYPPKARKKGLTGVVYVRFIVNKKGKVVNVQILKGVHPLLDKAAIEAVKKLPDLNPGYQLDKPVSVIYQIPIQIQD